MNPQHEKPNAAARLRAAFDDSFGVAPADLAEAPLSFLQIGVAGRSYLVELAEMSGVEAGSAISPFPSTAPALLGITGIRGELIPVFSLARMLGLDANGTVPHWVVRCGLHETVGFAFDALEGHLGLDRKDLTPVEEGHGSRHVRATALASGVRHPILSLGTLLEDLRPEGAAAVNDERGLI